MKNRDMGEVQIRFAREKNGMLHFKKCHPDLNTTMIREAFYNFSEQGEANSGNLYRIGTAQFGECLKMIFKWIEENKKAEIITAWSYFP